MTNLGRLLANASLLCALFVASCGAEEGEDPNIASGPEAGAMEVDAENIEAKPAPVDPNAEELATREAKEAADQKAKILEDLQPGKCAPCIEEQGLCIPVCKPFELKLGRDTRAMSERGRKVPPKKAESAVRGVEQK
jgi:hypothetical protein